jgi:Domain of unknown function (DU1801)
MTPELHAWYLSKDEPVKSCLLALRSLVLKQDSDISETQKYGMPCFCFRKKMFCYLWTDKKTNEPYLLLVEGNRLKHRALEKGARSRMKILRVDAEKNLPVKVIKDILKSALDLYRKGILKA